MESNKNNNNSNNHHYDKNHENSLGIGDPNLCVVVHIVGINSNQKLLLVYMVSQVSQFVNGHEASTDYHFVAFLRNYRNGAISFEAL